LIIPSAPYMETKLISSSIQLKLNFTITAVIAYNNNAGALDNLEKLVIQILAAIPSGYVVGDVSRPSITTLGSSNFLTSDIDVSTYYKQEN
jgi:secreted protein with Ig-like and vWFA domain